MKILLIKFVPKVGNQGEVVEVSSGYAKNALLPKKLAVVATPEIIRNWEQKKNRESEQREKRKQVIAALLPELQNQTFDFKVKTGKNNEVFTSIHQEEIQKVIGKFLENKDRLLGMEDVHLDIKPIKELGEHLITTRLGRGEETIKAQVKIKVAGD
ncbi:MAG: 50S ribosomal protein L9 [Patescibacteria group bacterium]|nr:50S ribosomal protein L9 [Patescibacteria group bacterium]